MRRDLGRLDREDFDLCVIGGGINGLATAWDATLRGLKVALVERGDFGAATSANSLKILHGGLRYLQHLEVGRMLESIAERRAFQQMVPDLVEPLGFLVPAVPGHAKGRQAMRAALALHELLRGRSRLDRNVPKGKMLSAESLAQLVPSLPWNDATGGALFYDLQMINSDRVTLAFALGASQQGGLLLNYCEAIGFETSGQTVRALRVRDVETGAAYELRAKQFACMTGPWRRLLPNLVQPGSTQSQVAMTAGFQIVTKQQISGEYGVAIPAPHRTRHFFSTPWRGHTLWGTAEERWEGSPDDWRISGEDVQQFLDDLNVCLPEMQLTADDVVFAFGGLQRPDGAGETRSASRYRVYDHQKDLKLNNLISMEGVKYTVCRAMAEQAVDLILRKLGGGWRECTTRETAVQVGTNEDRNLLRERVASRWSDVIQDKVLRHYGGGWEKVVETAETYLDWGCIADSDVPRACVTYAVEGESALHLDDLILRRTDLGTLGDPGAAVTEEVLSILSHSRQLDGDAQERERKRLRNYYRWR